MRASGPRERDPRRRKLWEELRRYRPGGEMLWGVSVQVGLCGSWLVEAPQCQAHCNCQSRRHVADLGLTVLARIDKHLTKRIQLFHRHRKLFAKQVDQARNAGRAARHHDALNVFAARGCTEEVEGFLNLERQYIYNAPQYLMSLFVGHARTGF